MTVKEPQAASPPGISEIVGLLDRFAPQALADLRGRFPAQQELLRPGMVLGISEPALRLRAEAALATAVNMRQVTVQVRDVLRRRLLRSNRLELAGRIVALLGSSTAVFFILQKWLPSPAILSSAAALAGTILGMVTAYQRAGLGGRRDGLLRTFELLVDAPLEADEIRRDLEIALRPETGEAGSRPIAQLIQRMEKLSRRVNRATLEVPGFPRATP